MMADIIKELRADGIFENEQNTEEYILDLLDRIKRLEYENTRIHSDYTSLSQKSRLIEDAYEQQLKAMRHIVQAQEKRLMAGRVTTILPTGLSHLDYSYTQFGPVPHIPDDDLYSDISNITTTIAKQVTCDKESDDSQKNTASTGNHEEKMELHFERAYANKSGVPEPPPRNYEIEGNDREPMHPSGKVSRSMINLANTREGNSPRPPRSNRVSSTVARLYRRFGKGRRRELYEAEQKKLDGYVTSTSF